MKHLGFFAFLLGIVPLGFSTMLLVVGGFALAAVLLHAISRRSLILLRNQETIRLVWDQMKPLCTWAREDEMGYLNSLEREFIS